MVSETLCLTSVMTSRQGLPQDRLEHGLSGRMTGHGSWPVSRGSAAPSRVWGGWSQVLLDSSRAAGHGHRDSLLATRTRDLSESHLAVLGALAGIRCNSFAS